MTPIERIDNLLELEGRTRKDLANAVGITTSAISTWSKRNSVPLADTAIKIADYLGTTVKYIMTGEEENIIYNKDPLINECVTLLTEMSLQQKQLVLDVIRTISKQSL